MRTLAFLIGITAVTGASAGDYAPSRDADAVTAQLVYQMRFGGLKPVHAAAERFTARQRAHRLDGALSAGRRPARST